MTPDLRHLEVRVNVRWPATLLELTESRAVVEVRADHPTPGQTTLAIRTDDGEMIYLPVRVVLAESGRSDAGQARRLGMELLQLSSSTRLSVERLLARRGSAREPDTIPLARRRILQVPA